MRATRDGRLPRHRRRLGRGRRAGRARPLGPAARSFVAAARAAGRRACFFAADPRLAEATGWRAIRIGLEPSWDPQRWPGVLREHASLRYQVRRAARKGVTVRRADLALATTRADAAAVVIDRLDAGAPHAADALPGRDGAVRAHRSPPLLDGRARRRRHRLRGGVAGAGRARIQQLTIDGWGFDVELLYIARLHGYQIREIGVPWRYGSDSRVSPLRDTLTMIRDIGAVWRNSCKGRYDPLPTTDKDRITSDTTPATRRR